MHPLFNGKIICTCKFYPWYRQALHSKDNENELAQILVGTILSSKMLVRTRPYEWRIGTHNKPAFQVITRNFVCNSPHFPLSLTLSASLIVLYLFNNKEQCLEQFVCLFSLDLPTAVGGGEREKEKESTGPVQAAGSAPWRAAQHSFLRHLR